MEQFPTDEDQFELMYNDDLELLDQIQDKEMLNVEPVRANKESKLFSNRSLKINETHKSIVQSPHLSQIPYDESNEQGFTVNRKLFGTPIDREPKKISSTPLNNFINLNQIKNCHQSELDQIKSNVENEDLSEFALEEVQLTGLNKKRRLEDLFGDIHDIEQNEYEDPEIKKFKLEEERDLETIAKILEARKKQRLAQSSMNVDSVDQLNVLHEFKMRNLSYTIPKWPCITLVRDDHERVYVRMHSESYESQHIDEIKVFVKGYKSLLGQTKEDVWNTAREITFKRLTGKTKEMPKQQDVPFSGDNLPLSQNLWVDKYRPKKYLDLLSDETTNRSLLFWLKMWDKIVFERDFIKKSENGKFQGQELNSFNKRTGKFESTGGWNRKTKQNLNTDLDQHGRPMQKVALLCGPPGLGKTTLAHTIARHAGYTVREMNASDDRSPDAFRLALENGTQMTSVLNEDRRPNCIILDEIDGAPSQSIEFLIRFIGDNFVTKTIKGKEQKSILKRPIICICNDMYSPALRQLRQIAFVVNFPPIESSRLAERLLEICRKENLTTDLGTLLALADKSGNDVRSCISMLQFYNVNNKKLTLIDVLNSNLGQKDRQRGLFGIWSALFQIQRPQRQITEKSSNFNSESEKPSITMTNTSFSTRAKYISDIVHMGDYERLTQGVFENYLAQKMPDPNMDGVAIATQWFCFSDLLQNQISRLQNYSIYPYLQSGFIMWHFLFASLGWPKINFPNKGFEANQKSTMNKMIFTSFKKGINCCSIGIGQGSIILTETIPFLKRILSPNLRSVSSQLLTIKERQELSQTVKIMADLGLVYTQTKTIDGTYQYCLEPDVDILCKFPDSKGITLTYFGRQLIAREVELEKMRRSMPKNFKSDKKQNNVSISKSDTIDIVTKTKVVEPKKLPNHLQYLKPIIKQSKSDQKESISKDFFGRICTKSTIVSANEGISDPIVKSPIWYRYKEGFNNAVRKDITMIELL